MLTQKVERGSVDQWPTVSKTGDITAVHVKVKKHLLQDLLCRVDGFLRGGLQFYAVEVQEDLTVVICRISEEYYPLNCKPRCTEHRLLQCLGLGTAVEFDI